MDRISRILSNASTRELPLSSNVQRHSTVENERTHLFTPSTNTRRRGAYNGNVSYRPSLGRKSSGKFKANSKSVLKDVYLVDHDISVMPRGIEKAEMHCKKQVITAFRIPLLCYCQISFLKGLSLL